MNFRSIHRWVRRIWISFGLAVMAILVWSVQERGVPPWMMQSNARVQVASTSYGRSFTPADPTVGVPALLFLPGGLIDPDAYVPLVRGIAEAGFPAALVELPLRAAPTAQARATLWARIREARDSVGSGRSVVLSGHSRGGMFAATFAADHPTELAGLVLIGTTHPRDRDLSRVSSPVLKVLGSADCIASIDDARVNAALLPPDTQWTEIAGGNHRQFAYYGWQLGDCTATITREEQHRQTIEAMVSFLRAVRN